METELPDYRKIASEVKRNKIEIKEEEIEAALRWFQLSRAKFTLKNQPAQKGDFLEIEYWLDQLSSKDAFILGQGHFLPGFEESLVGMKIGEEKENIALKKDGQDIKVKVRIKSVQNVELAEFENLNELKKNIKEGLISEKEQTESQRWRNAVLEKISQETKCEVPEVLVEQAKKQILEDFQNWIKENLKISFENYLIRIKKTEKEVLDYFLNQARQRVKILLVLREIGKKEGVDPEESKGYTKEVLRIEKVFQLLENL